MAKSPSDVDHLLDRIADGDEAARNRLLEEHRDRLRALVAVRLDRRLAPRVDPSDIVQETLLAANARLEQFAAERPVPFNIWLREIALERLVDGYRRHVAAQRRSVRREEFQRPRLPDESLSLLVERLAASGKSPSQQVQRRELSQRVRAVLEELPETDREVLVMRHLEHLSMREIAHVLMITETAVKVRHLRALKRLRAYIGDSFAEEAS